MRGLAKPTVVAGGEVVRLPLTTRDRHGARAGRSRTIRYIVTAAETGPTWTIEFYDEDGREPVLDFLRGLDGVKERALIAALRNVLAYEGIGVCGSSWGKWVQGAPGIFEFRVRHDAATILRERGLPVPADLDMSHRKVLLRVFCHAHGEKIVLLLAAYDKGKEPSAKRQNAEIKRAKQRLARWKSRQETGKRGRPKA